MVAWPDFRSRLRRFLVIGVGMALVLAITLLLSAFSEGFNLRGERLVGVFDADRYAVVEGSSGPMTATSPFPAEVADQLLADPGVTAAEPILLAPNAILVEDQPVAVVVAAANASGGWPSTILEGRGVEGPGEAVVDSEIDELGVGDRFVIAGAPMAVVGVTEFASWDIATAGVFIDPGQAQELLAGGRSLVTAIAIDGEPSSVPEGLQLQSRSAAVDDVVNRTADAKRSIDSFRATLWVLAVVIVGAVLYLAALERVRDFAIFKATGASNADLVLGLALQAVMLGVIAGVLSIGLAHLMKPIYPGLLSLPFSVAWPVIPVAVVIAVLSSFVGVRRAISVDPSQAFG
ncbi:MAG: ABC transporter permease [Actinomycetota bacterium]